MSALAGLVDRGLMAADWAEALAPVDDRIGRMGRFLREEVTLEEARHEAVVTFLALLEMAKLGVIRLWQGVASGEEDDGSEVGAEDIVIARADGATAAAAATAESVDDEYR